MKTVKQFVKSIKNKKYKVDIKRLSIKDDEGYPRRVKKNNEPIKLYKEELS